MKFGKSIFCASLAIAVMAISGSPLMGHNVFKKTLGEKYDDMKISCNACHVQGEAKTERNAFGKLFHKELKELSLSEKYKEIKDRDEKKAFENEVMAPAFEKAYKKISAMSFEELIKAGMIDGIDPPEDE